MSNSAFRTLINFQVRRNQLANLPPLPLVGEPLRNPRHELYVRCIMGLMTCKEAYLACGYSTRSVASIKGNAAKIRNRPDVDRRIREIGVYERRRELVAGVAGRSC